MRKLLILISLVANCYLMAGGATATMLKHKTASVPVTALGASTTNHDASAQVTSTFSYTVSSSGANRLLVVGFSERAASAPTFTVTYAGASMTQLDCQQIGSAGPNDLVCLFYLKNPATGANTVLITASVVMTECNSGAQTYQNVNQSTPLGTEVTAGGQTGGPATATVTTASVNELAIDVTGGQGTPFTMGSGGTEVWSRAETTYFGNYSGSLVGTGGSDTRSWTLPFPTDWRIIAVPLKAA